MPISTGAHIVYPVMPGDTLYKIANEFGASLNEIVLANGLYPPFTDPGLIYPGQRLLVRIPGESPRSTVIYQVAAGDTLYKIAEQYSVNVDMLATLNQIEQPDILLIEQRIYVPAFVYTVQPGDSLYRISRRFGVPLSSIIKVNRNRPSLSLDVIYPGYELLIPFSSSTNIIVLLPIAGTKIVQGQPLTGFARVFEATVLYQILDQNGSVITSQKVITASEGAPAFGEFQTRLTFDQSPTTPLGTLWVYSRSAKDGSIQDLVEVPVRF